MHYKRNSKGKLGCRDKLLSLHPRNITYSIPIVCAFSLLLLGWMVINPVGSIGRLNGFGEFGDGAAYAVDSGTAEAVSRSSTLNTTLSITVDNDVTMNPTYVEPGKVAYRSHIVKVNATDITNYTLQLTAAEGATTTLNNGSTSIPGTNAVVGKDMETNTWGFGWGEVNSDNSEQTYYALPAYGSTGADISTGLLEASQASDNGTVDLTRKLTFAANLGDGNPSGHYTTTALLSLAATPKQLVFDGITTMQEMTSTICANAEENDTTRLRDTRDNKYYWVAKLKDGNCWMTQNLALDLTDITLTPQDSDVAEDWTPNLKSELWETPSGYKLEAHYYNHDEIVWAEVRAPSNMIDLCTTSVGLESCSNYSFKNVKGLQASNAIMPEYEVIDQDVYDAHYLVGNYYDANAASAGFDLSTVEGDFELQHSICPVKWSLPGENNLNALTDAYGSDNPMRYKLSPLYFVPAGHIQNSSVMAAGGEVTYILASGAHDSGDDVIAIGRITMTTFAPSASFNLPTTYGSPIRCVAR